MGGGNAAFEESPVQDRVGRVGRLVVDASRQRHRRVDHEHLAASLVDQLADRETAEANALPELADVGQGRIGIRSIGRSRRHEDGHRMTVLRDRDPLAPGDLVKET
jgi:hypothetical protein